MRDRAGIVYLSETQPESVIVERRLTALTHHITVDALRLAFLGLKRDAAPGANSGRS
jgi:hypothetical protein